MSAQNDRVELWARVREVARPIVVYWVFLGLMYGAFCVSVLFDDPSAEGMWALLGFGAITAVSVFIGQVMALLRVRDWVVFAYWMFMWTFGFAFGIFAANVSGPLGVFIFIFVFFGPIFTLGGLWSLRVNRAIFATWVPLIYATGTAIIMAESKGKVDTWKEGAKWAVWDAFTFSVLGLAIVLLLVFLVTRETHRLHQWRHDPAAPLRGSVKESGAARPRLSLLGWALLCMLAVGLTVGTAAIGPYLWRTGPGDDGSNGGEPSEEPADTGGDQPSEDPGDGDPADQLRKQADSVTQQVQQDMEQRLERSISILSTLLLLLLLFLAALLVFWRPARRLLTVRHFRRPYWPQPATTRIEDGWRLVEIAVADAGIEPRPNEPAERLYHRSREALEKISGNPREVHGLLEAARIRDRVAYGLGVRPGEVELMEKVAQWAYDTVWDRLGDKEQIKALYRRL